MKLISNYASFLVGVSRYIFNWFNHGGTHKELVHYSFHTTEYAFKQISSSYNEHFYLVEFDASCASCSYSKISYVPIAKQIKNDNPSIRIFATFLTEEQAVAKAKKIKGIS